MYDIFFVSTKNNSEFNKLKFKYPRIQLVKNPKSFDDIKRKAFTKMFWVIWDDVVLDAKFDLNSYRATKWDDMYVHVFKNEKYHDGICLFPKNLNVSNKEWTNRYFIDKKELDIVASVPLRYEKYKFNSYQDYENVLKSANDMFWGQWPNTEVIDESVFDLYFQHFNYYDRNENHVFLNSCNDIESFRSGLVLFSKNKPISKREFEQQYLIDKKEHHRLATKSQYPRYIIDSYENYLKLMDLNYDMFWGVWPNVLIENSTELNLFYDQFDGANNYDRKENHVFLNACDNNTSFLNGIVLFSKHKPISKKEFDRKYLIDKKEHNSILSRFQYPKLNLTDYDSYISFLQNTESDLFWGIWDNTDVINESIFNFYYDPKDGRYDHDRKENHVFLNACNESFSYLNGLLLLSKHKPISKKEFDRKYLIDKKEHDIISTRYRYPKLNLTDYDSYISFLQNIESDLFWGIWSNVDIIDQTIFDFYYEPNDGKYDHDRKENHVFLNACNDNTSYLNGIVLFSKHKPISKKEFDRKYLIDKKEHEKVISRFRYPIYKIDTYDEYRTIMKSVENDLFWCVWPEIEITEQSIFDFYYDPKDGKYDFDRMINHVYQNSFKESFNYNGMMLMSKHAAVSKKEIDFRYLINKKEHEKLVSQHKLYDIIFISYAEPNADKNWELLKTKFPKAKRVHGVRGIHQAHIKAASLVDTDMFWVVDGDAIVEDNFNFSHVCNRYERNIVYVWRSKNPINELIYGYGGVKLLPTSLTLNMEVGTSDMTTSISDQFRVMPEISNVTEFNTDPFNTWKSAFRECVKLSSRTIIGQEEEETKQRLDIWCSVGKDRPYGEYAIQGAIAGKDFGHKYKDNQEMLSKINDFEWLKQHYGI